MRSALALLALASCVPPSAMPAPPPGIMFVMSERGRGGGHLVVVDAHGDRQAELLAPPAGTGIVRDTQVAFSPDGQWIVFASSRGRLVAESSLWAARAVVGATPFRLTVDRASDLQPVWMRDGSGVVFVSSRAGTLDLWWLPLANVDGILTPGPAAPITSGPEADLMPSTSPDGHIAFAEITGNGSAGTASRVMVIGGPDDLGRTRRRPLTAGPADTAPAFSPDGSQLMFARPTVRVPQDTTQPVTIDSDLWVRATAGGERKLLDLPGTDETAPTWSSDGQLLLATSVVRNARGDSLLSSVIALVLGDGQADAVPRMLVDRIGPLARTSPAIAPGPIDLDAVRGCPLYRDELARILTDAARADHSTGQ